MERQLRGRKGRSTAGSKQRHLRLVSPRRRCTLLELIQKIQDAERGDEEVVATIARLIESGRVVLCNAFTGTTLGSTKGEARKPAATGNRPPATRTGKVRFAR